MVLEQQGRNTRQFKRRKGKLTLKKLSTKINQLEAQPESKIMDYKPLDKLITTAGLIDPLTSIIQGDQQDQRNGSKIKLTSMFMRLHLNYFTPTTIAGPIVPDLIRLLIFKWKSKTVPAVTDVLELGDVLSPIKNSATDMIKVIYDNSLTINPNITGPPDYAQFYNGSQFIDKVYKKLSITFKYEDSIDLTPNLNQLYLLAISKNTAYVNLTLYNRVRFLDS